MLRKVSTYGLIWLILFLYNFKGIGQVQPLSRNDSANIAKAWALYNQELNNKNLKEASRYLNDLALIYWNHNQFQQAIDYYEKSLVINEQLANENGQAMLHGNLGLLYADLKKYEKSYEHWLKVVAARKYFGNKESIVESLIDCAVSLNSLKRYNESLDMLEEASLMARSIPDQDRMLAALLKCYRNLSETYEKAGNQQKSKQYYDQYRIFSEKKDLDLNKLKSAVDEEKYLKEMAINQTKIQEQELIRKQFELRKSSLDLQSIEKENKILDSTLSLAEIQLRFARQKAQTDSLLALTTRIQLQREKAVRNSFGLAALSLIAISFFIWRNYIQVKKSRKLLAEKNTQIETQNKELDELNQIITRNNMRMKKELEVGQEIQMSLLPKDQPSGLVDIHSVLIPSREVGGDLYEYFMADPKTLIFGIGDVSGKGVPAALLMAVCKTMIKTHAHRMYSPAQIMTIVNDEICQQNEHSMFITYFLGVLHLDTGRLVYTNAGHLYPMVIRDRSLSELKELHGPVIGAAPGIEYEESEYWVQAQDQIILYTDGVTEAVNDTGDFYSHESLEACLTKSIPGTLDRLIHSVVEDTRLFRGNAEQSDDISMLGIQIKSPS